MTAAVYALAFLNDSAKPFSIRGDGHGSFSIEINDKDIAFKIEDQLNQRKFVEHPIQMLQRPFFYRLH